MMMTIDPMGGTFPLDEVPELHGKSLAEDAAPVFGGIMLIGGYMVGDDDRGDVAGFAQGAGEEGQAGFVERVEEWGGEASALVADGAEVAHAFFDRPRVCGADPGPERGKDQADGVEFHRNVIDQQYIRPDGLFQATRDDLPAVVFVVPRHPVDLVVVVGDKVPKSLVAALVAERDDVPRQKKAAPPGF